MVKVVLSFVFLAPLFVSAMGNPFRPAYMVNPNPIGVNEDCSFKYESGGYNRPDLFGKVYDTTCLYILKSAPISVGQDCQYDDYKQTGEYKKPLARMTTQTQFESANKEILTEIKYGLVNIQKFKEYFANIYQSPTGNLEYELLLGKYCQKATPTKAREAFSMNVDVPATIISFWDEEYIKSRWDQELESLTRKYPDTDFQSLVELNLHGAQLWKKMLTCAQGDAELARYQYFSTQFNCDGGQQLKEEIKNYVESVKIYFSTSFIKPLKIDMKYKFQVIDAVVNKDGSGVKANYDSFPTFHPLFIQAIEQMLVDIYPVGSNDQVRMEYSAKKLGINKDRPQSTLLQAISQLDHFMPNGLPPQGLWPSANFAVYSQVQRVRMQYLHELVDDIEIKNFDGLAFGSFTRLPEFYSTYRTKLADEVRLMNQRYGL